MLIPLVQLERLVKQDLLLFLFAGSTTAARKKATYTGATTAATGETGAAKTSSTALTGSTGVAKTRTSKGAGNPGFLLQQLLKLLGMKKRVLL